MKFKVQDVSLIAGVIIFLFTAVMGLTSGIGITVVLFRSTLAAVVLGLLIFGFTFYLKTNILPSLHPDEEDVDQEFKGTKIDLNAGEEEDLTSLLQNNATEEKPKEKSEFVPFAPQQIDPNLKEMIKNNPKQAAEVIRKMGLDQ